MACHTELVGRGASRVGHAQLSESYKSTVIMQAAVKESARCIMKDSRLVTGILKIPRAMLNSVDLSGKNMQGKVAAAIQVQFSVAPL